MDYHLRRAIGSGWMKSLEKFSFSTGRDQSNVFPSSMEAGIGIGPPGRDSFDAILLATTTSDQLQLVKPVGGFSLVNFGCSVREY